MHVIVGLFWLAFWGNFIFWGCRLIDTPQRRAEARVRRQDNLLRMESEVFGPCMCLTTEHEWRPCPTKLCERPDHTHG